MLLINEQLIVKQGRNHMIGHGVFNNIHSIYLSKLTTDLDCLDIGFIFGLILPLLNNVYIYTLIYTDTT